MLRSEVEREERMSTDELGATDLRSRGGIDLTSHIGEGTTVEVQSRFDDRWTRGFTVVDVTDEGYRLRRQSDGSVLPAWFPREQLRPLGRTA